MNERDTISCEEALNRLWEYIDGELTPERADGIREHMRKCECCFPQYDFQKAFRTFMRRQAEQPVPPGLRQRVFERLLAEQGD